MRLGILILINGLLLALPIALHGQEDPEQPESVLNYVYSRNLFFVEALGSAGSWSLNYERRIIPRQDLKVGFRFGVSVSSYRRQNAFRRPDSAEAPGLFLPLIITGQYGKGVHHLEFGGGLTLRGNSGVSGGNVIYPTIGNRLLVMGALVLGYRYHPPFSGVMFRVTYAPLYEYFNFDPPEGRAIYHWFGVSIGLALKNYRIK